MQDFEDKVKLVTQLCGDAIQTVFGRGTDFIIIPIIETDTKTQVGVISNLHPEKLCFNLTKATEETIKQIGHMKCDCEDPKGDNVVSIKKDLY